MQCTAWSLNVHGQCVRGNLHFHHCWLLGQVPDMLSNHCYPKWASHKQMLCTQNLSCLHRGELHHYPEHKSPSFGECWCPFCENQSNSKGLPQLAVINLQHRATKHPNGHRTLNQKHFYHYTQDPSHPHKQTQVHLVQLGWLSL